MSKFIYLIISVILLVVVLFVPAFSGWLINVYNLIIKVNTFFAVMPAWLNFLIVSIIIAMLIAFARALRK